MLEQREIHLNIYVVIVMLTLLHGSQCWAATEQYYSPTLGAQIMFLLPGSEHLVVIKHVLYPSQNS
jgi:hypothetical protein